MSSPSMLHVVTVMDAGGLEILVTEQAKHQIQRGCVVNNRCAGGWTGVLASGLEALGVGVYPTTRYKNWRRGYYFSASANQILRGTKPSILRIHINGIVAVISLLLLARWNGARRFARAVYNSFVFEHLSRVCIRWRRFELSLARWFGAKLVGVGQNVRQNEITGVGIEPKCIGTLLNGVNLEQFIQCCETEQLSVASLINQDIPQDQVFLIGCVARFHEQKKHAQMIRMMAELARRDLPRTPHLLLVGIGPLQAEMMQLASDLGIRDRVHFLGLRRDVPELLQALDLFAISSRWEEQGILLIVTMVTGKPAVATRVSGLKQVVREGETRCLVELTDVSGFADVIEQLIRHPQQCERIEATIRVVVEAEYSLVACARNYDELYSIETSDEVRGQPQ